MRLRFWGKFGWFLLLAPLAVARPVAVDIPAQPMPSALIALSRQTGIEVMFPFADVKKLRSAPLKGDFEPEAALAKMLEGTGYTAALAGGKFAVAAASAEKPPALAAPTPRVARQDRAVAPSTDDVVQLEKFVITPSRFAITDSPSLAGATFTHDEIVRLPQLGEDVFRTITRVPGLSASDFSAKFWVRGAPNEKVLTRLDGATLLEPFHLKDLDGALAVVDLETIASLDLYTGGFTTEFGDRLAGVMTMETVGPSSTRPQTTVGLSVMGARVTNRGIFADGRGRWLVSGRMGYPDIALQLTDNEEIKPRYHDAFAKLEYDFTPEHTVALNVLHAHDTFRQKDSNGASLSSRYADDYLWLRWRARFSDTVSAETVLSQAWLGWHRNSDARLTGNGQVLRRFLQDDRQLSLSTLRQDWSVGLGKHALFRTGFELTKGLADYDYHSVHDTLVVQSGSFAINTDTRGISFFPRGNSAGLYAAVRTQPLDGLTVEPGVRYDRENYASGSSLSPRLNLAYSLGRDTTLRAAWGFYRQAEGLHEVAVGDGETTFSQAERARQAVLSIEHRVSPGVLLRAEAYDRSVDHPRPHWINLVNPLSVIPELQFDRALLVPTEGHARGIEVGASGVLGRELRWSASYAWAKAEETVAGRIVPLERDQRHTVQTSVIYSPNEKWDFSAGWQFHSGWPTTETVFVPHPLAGGGTFFATQVGTPLGARLPAYHRLDFRVTRLIRLEHSTLRLFLDVFNAYGADNVFRFSLQGRVEGNQFIQTRVADKSIPLLPSVGVIWDF